MKIELDIADSEIKAQIENRVRDAITNKANGWNSERYIKDRIEALWPVTVDRIIAQLMEDSPRLKTVIASEIEKKLRRKIATLMNATDGQLSLSDTAKP